MQQTPTPRNHPHQKEKKSFFWSVIPWTSVLQHKWKDHSKGPSVLTLQLSEQRTVMGFTAQPYKRMRLTGRSESDQVIHFTNSRSQDMICVLIKKNNWQKVELNLPKQTQENKIKDLSSFNKAEYPKMNLCNFSGQCEHVGVPVLFSPLAFHCKPRSARALWGFLVCLAEVKWIRKYSKLILRLNYDLQHLLK